MIGLAVLVSLLCPFLSAPPLFIALACDPHSDRLSSLRQRRDWFDNPRVYEDISRRGLTSPYPNLVGPLVDALDPRDPSSLLKWYTETRATIFKRQAETAMLLRARPDDSARSISTKENFHLGSAEACVWDNLVAEFLAVAPPVRPRRLFSFRLIVISFL